MGPWSRVSVAKCQMLVTSFFVLVPGSLGGDGLGLGVVRGEVWRLCLWASSTVVPLPHTSALLSPSCPRGHAPGAPGSGLPLG